MSITDLRNMINNDNSEIDMKNIELKAFLERNLSTLFNYVYQKVKTNLSLFIPLQSV